MISVNRLTKREREVVNQVLQGKTNKLIASSLGIAERTVEFHLKNIYAKLEVSSRIELVLKLGNSTGTLGIEKPGNSTVEKTRKNANNGVKFNLWKGWANLISVIGKELEMKAVFKYPAISVITALITGFSWVAWLISNGQLVVDDFRMFVTPLIVVLSTIGLTIGFVGKRIGETLLRVFLGTLMGIGLGPFAVILLMFAVVLPVGKFVAELGLINPATMPAETASNLAMSIMLILWFVVGIGIGLMLLFVTIKKASPLNYQQDSL